jgi:hypothetical protein
MVAPDNEARVNILIYKDIIEDQYFCQGTVPSAILKHGIWWPSGAS